MDKTPRPSNQKEPERLVCTGCGAVLRAENGEKTERIGEKYYCAACARRFKEPVIDLIEYALNNGCITSSDLHHYVDNYSRYLGGKTYTFNELFQIIMEYEISHPDMFPELMPLCTWEWDNSGDPYESNGIRFSYLSSKQQLYSCAFHEVAAGCGWSSLGETKLTPWDALLKREKEHCAKWDENTWRVLCDDYKQHPEMHCAALDNLIERRLK